MAEPGDRERSLLGGRLLGTKPVVDGVAALGKGIGALTKELTLVTKDIHAHSQEFKGKGRSAAQSWNSGSNWGGWGTHNGGGYKINGQAQGLGMTGGSIQGLSPAGTLPVAGMPQGRGALSIYGSHAPASAGNGGGATFGGMAVGAAVSSGAWLKQWGDAKGGMLSQANYIGAQAYNNGGVGSVTGLARGLVSNNAVGTGFEDRVRARMTMMNTLGYDGKGSLGTQAAGVLNPMASQAALAGNVASLTSAQGINSLRMWGITPVNNAGHRRSLTNINEQILQRFGAGGAMTASQRRDTFRNQNSGLNRSLQSMGLSPDVIESITKQGDQEAKVRAQGGDVGRFQSLLTQAGTVKGGKAAKKALDEEFQYKVPLVQSQKRLAASANDRDLAALGGFTKTVEAASDSMTAFNQAIGKFLDKTGVGGVLGGAAGIASTAGIGAGVGTAAAWAGKAMFAKRLLGAAGRTAVPAGTTAAGGISAGAGVMGAGAVAGAALAYAGVKGIHGANSERGERLQKSIRNEQSAAGQGGALSGVNAWFKASLSQGLGSMPGIGGAVRNSLGTDDNEEGVGGPGDGVAASVVVSRAAGFSRSGTNWGVGKCQTFVRTCMGSPGGASSAAGAWAASKYKHPGDGNPPAGAPVYWVGGSRGYGHVAVSAGGGMVYSTDVKRPGKVDLVAIAWINQHWRSQRYVGWSEDNNGIRVKVGKAGPMSGAGASTGAGKDAGADSGSDSTSGTSSSGGSTAAAGVLGAYGSINESDAVAGALGRSGASAGPGGAIGAEGSTDGPGVLAASAGGPQTSGAKGSAGGIQTSGARATVQQMAAARGWTGSQWDALNKLVQHESSWNPRAANPGSSARGLFQKMTSIHGSIEGSVAGQAKWGLNYIAGRYGDPVKAWAHWQQAGNYAKGSFNIEADQNATVHKGEMIIPTRQAEEIRQALLNNSVPQATGRSGGNVTLEFGPGSMVFKFDGSMDEDSGRKAAKQFAKYLAEDERLKRMGVGS